MTEELGSEIHVIFSLDAPPVRHDTISDIAGDGDDEDAAVVIAEGRSLWTARVAACSHVRPGQPVAIVEAMKMEHVITADDGGIVRAIAAQPGDILFGPWI